MAKAHSKQRRKADWPAIQQAYMEGQPIETIAETFGVAAGTIYNRSSLEHWSANLPEIALDKLLFEKIAQRRAARTGMSVKEAEAAETDERALGLEIIRHHIVQAERVHIVVTGILEGLIRDPHNIPPEKLETLSMLQQITGSITTTTSRLAALRRQAWQLDDHDDSPDKSQMICSKELEEIYQRGMEKSRLADLKVAGRSAMMAAYSDQMYSNLRDTGGTVAQQKQDKTENTQHNQCDLTD